MVAPADENEYYYLRPITVTAVGNAQLDTAEKKFGNSSLVLDGTGDYATAENPVVDSDNNRFFDFNTLTYDYSQGGDGWFISIWVYPTSNTGDEVLISSMLNNSGDGWYLKKIGNKIQAKYGRTGLGFSTIDSTITMTWSTWTNITWVSNGTTGQIFVDGVRFRSSAVSGLGQIQGGSEVIVGAQKLPNGTVSDEFDGHIDEVFMNGASRGGYDTNNVSISVPTQPYSSASHLLLHFDGEDASTTIIDSIPVTHSGACSVSSDFSLPAVTPDKFVNSDDVTMSSDVVAHIQANGIMPAGSILVSQTTASLTAKNAVALVDPYYVIEGYADDDYFLIIPDQYQQYLSQSQATITAGFLTTASADLATDCQQSASATNITGTDCVMAADSATAITARNIISPTGYYVVYDYWTEGYAIKIGQEPFVFGDTQLTATAGRRLGGELITASDFQVASVPGYQLSAESSLASDTETQQTVSVTNGAASDMAVDTNTSQSAGLRYSIDEILAADTNLTGTAIVEIIPYANVFGNTQITLTPDLFVGTSVTANADAEFAFGIIPTATAGILFSVTGTFASDYQIEFYPGQTHFGELSAVSEVAALFQADRIVGASLSANSDHQILATVTHILGGVMIANAEYDFAVTMTYAEFGALLSFGQFALTAEITLYKIDPFRTLIVPSETRHYQMLQETRQETVVSEDRINIVRPESRDISVTSETRVYKLPIPAIDVATNRRPG